MGERRGVVAVACAVAVALAPGTPRADGAPSDRRRWRLTALSVGFADDFLGVPHDRLNDDNGFVADLRIAGELSDGDRQAARLVASEQIITERGGLHRVDDGKLFVEWQRSPASPRGVTLGWMAGLDVVGDLGGSRLQNWAHQTLFSGRVLGGAGPARLQDRYPGRFEVLGMVGGRARGVYPLQGPVSLRAGMDAAVGAGTAFFAELHPYVAAGISVGFADLELREGAGSYWTTVRALTMAGGYVTRLFQSQPSARLVLTGPPSFPVVLGLELDWNSGNTSQHVGGITLGARF